MKKKKFIVVSLDPDGNVRQHLANGKRRLIKDKTDWKRLAAMTPKEIHAAALSDPDCPPTKSEDWIDAWCPADLAVLRKSLGLSQSRFAKTYGLNVRTVQDWEQGRKFPDNPARVLVSLICRAPKKVADLLHKR